MWMDEEEELEIMQDMANTEYTFAYSLGQEDFFAGVPETEIRFTDPKLQQIWLDAWKLAEFDMCFDEETTTMH